MYIEEIPLRIAKLRTAKGVSARDMSLSLGQNVNYINNIENGKALPSMNAFCNICEYLGVSQAEFFDENNRTPERLRALIADLKQLDDTQLQAVSTLVHGLLQKN